jgi:PAS domain S-box-containing protein
METGGEGGEIEAVFAASPSGEPYTSREIAEELGCARTTAYKKLRGLVEDGVLETKKVGAKARVWWLPPGAKSGYRGPDESEDDRERTYEQLLASERQFRAVFEEAFDTILIADDDARYVEVNPAACELFGLPREELLGRTIAEFAAEGYDFEEAWRDFQESDLDRGLFPLIRPDGEQRIVEFAATPNILPGRNLSVIRDVTERQEAKTKLAHERERARRYQKSLAADAVIELEIRLETGVAGDLADELDAACEFEGAVSTSDGGLLHYVTVEDAQPAAVLAATTAHPAVTDSRIVFAGETATLVEFAADRSPVKTLVEAGASTRSMRSAGDGTTLVAEIGADADLQGLLNEFRAAYPDAEILTKRTVDRPIVTTRQYRESLASGLTERQIQSLRAAYLGGYFEWPRNSQAEEIADSMGIATTTWLRHLRLAESKIVSWFVEELEG